jgi:two-component system, response regulator, stage 0 sporulation protein F
MDKLALIEMEMSLLGLLEKAREIYSEFDANSALSYIKSHCYLLGKVYRSGLNPCKEEKAGTTQRRLRAIELIHQTRDQDLLEIIKKDIDEKRAIKKKILVVEDEFGLQETFREVFLMEGYEVRVAVDGENGYQNFLTFKPDLVFTDVVMPKISGIELIKKIRLIDPTIKVIYISGFFGLKNVKQDLDEEILRYRYPYLSKPFKITTMLELVDNYLNNKNPMKMPD